MMPGQSMRVVETVKVGTAYEISVLMRDVAGESVSLSAGGTMSGPSALEALSMAQAECLVALRASRDWSKGSVADLVSVQALLHDHLENLLQWVSFGEMPSDLPNSPSDLTLIGREFLVTPDLRMAAIGLFVATSEVMRAGLETLSV